MKLATRSMCVAMSAALATLANGQVLAQGNAAPINHADVLAPFLSDDSIAVTYVDLTSIDPAALLARFVPILNPEIERQEVDQTAATAKAALDKLRQAGVRRVYAVGGLGDINERGGPVVIVPVADQKAADVLRDTLRQLGLPLGGAVVGGPSGPLKDVRMERHASGVMLLCNEATLDRYAIALATPRPDLVEPLARAISDGASIAAVLAPGPDGRRVIRELMPAVEPPFAALSGPLVADRLKHVELAAKLSPKPTAQLAIVTTDPETAALIRRLYGELPRVLAQMPDRQAAEWTDVVVKSLDVRAEGTRVTVGLPADRVAMTRLGAILTDALSSARDAARRQQRMSKFKVLGIALANYEASQRHLPPAAIRDAEGRPLLSWRVAILPHLGQRALYNQFRLNEPWDSPHNRALIRLMPDSYADPDPKLAALVREGKTIYQMPVGPETIFYKNDGTKITEITDGTSNTITIVEVAPERAVEWTKPADWEVDLQNPLDGVRSDQRKGFAATFVDGHGQFIQPDIAPARFRAMLTRAGGEEIHWSR
ncbi:MAG: DUF1559 domain-containing protein [Pirellulales bacterium]